MVIGLLMNVGSRALAVLKTAAGHGQVLIGWHTPLRPAKEYDPPSLAVSFLSLPLSRTVSLAARMFLRGCLVSVARRSSIFCIR